jgi:hypothetical protein
MWDKESRDNAAAHAVDTRVTQPVVRGSGVTPRGSTLEVEMLRMMKDLDDPVQSAIRLKHWLILNARALTWVAIAIGGVLFVGVFLDQ